MPTPYKLKILNGVLKLKTFSDHVLSILGIKDLGTQTGDVTNGYVDWSIQHLTKTTAQWAADTTTILLRGQLGVEDTGNTTFKIKIGNGTDLWSALGYAGGGGSSTWGGITGTLSDQTDLQNALDGKVDENAAIVGATKTKITYDSKGFVTAGEDATTADINASTNRNYVTDAQLTVIGNTSGTNSGDNAANTTSNTYADGKVADSITNGITTIAPSQNAVFDALALKQNIVSGVDDTEIGYLNGVTSSIQTQLNNKGYTYQCGFTSTLNPADSTTYYPAIVYIAAVTTGNARTRHKAFKSGTKLDVNWTHNCSAGTNEGVTLKITNVTTATTVTVSTSIDMSVSSVNLQFTDVSLTYSTGDLLEYTLETPAWVTNPTALIFLVQTYLR